jgi:hypothetical protein
MVKRGRPSSYNPALVASICDEIATSDHGLVTICARPGMPTLKTMYLWMERHPEFVQIYARAKERQMDYMACQIKEIADTPQPGVIERTDKDGNVMVETRDMIDHRRLRIEARKWLMSKLAPKKYGDHQDVNITGSLDVSHRIAETLRRKRELLASQVDIKALPEPEE